MATEQRDVLSDRFSKIFGFKLENNVLIGKEVTPSRDYASLGSYVLDKLESTPKSIGQIDVFTETEDTYEKMRDRSVRCALWMKSRGIRPDDVIVVCSDNNLNAPLACYATLYVGAIFNPLYDGMTTKEMSHVIDLTRPKMAFANEKSAPIILEAAKSANIDLEIIVFGNVPGFENFFEIIELASDENVKNFRCVPIEKPDSIAMIVCSSGTSGLPKGVALSHRSILDQLDAWKVIDLSGKIFMNVSSMYWISGAIFIFSSLACRMTRMSVLGIDDHTACALVQKYKVEWLFLNGALINSLVKFPDIGEYDLTSVKVVVSGGQYLAASSVKTLSSCFPNAMTAPIYGMSELGGVLTQAIPRQKPESSGVIRSNVRLKIVNVTTGQVLGIGERGEICIKSLYRMECYYRNPEAMKGLYDSEGWLHTGDIGYYDEDGEIFIVDRIKEIIKYRGHHVPPAEIEAVIYDHPEVIEVAVTGIPHASDGDHALAFVVKTKNSKLTEQDVIDLVSSKLSDAKRIRGGVRFLDELPKTPTGKISRRKVRELAKSLASST